MVRGVRRTGALALGIVVLSGCAADDAGKVPVVKSGDRNGLSLRAEMSATEKSLVVETVVENGRTKPVYLDADQCGRVTDAVLARTRFRPKGKAWQGSLRAVKAFVLDRQASDEQPVSFAPRIPGDTAPFPPPCVRPERPVKLDAGETIAERWEMPFGLWPMLADVGSEGAAVRVDVVEARAPDDLSYLDMIQSRHADEARAGRNVRVEAPLSSLVDLEPTSPPEGPSFGELYDRLVENGELRRWIEAQPVGSWTSVELIPPYAGKGELRLVTTEYERAAIATAEPDGTIVSLELPTERDRTRVFTRRPGTLPPGIDVIDEPDQWVLHQDVLAPSVELPSGRLVVGEYLDDIEPLDLGVEPGSYPVHATLVKDPKGDATTVALGTIVLSEEPTARWKYAYSIAVDAGSTTITSPETVELLNKTLKRSEHEWGRIYERIWNSHAAQDHIVTEFTVRPGFDLAYFSSGSGDGRYPVYYGLDSAGRPTRVVVDFFELHLDWPS
jgi:hypothetical protein